MDRSGKDLFEILSKVGELEANLAATTSDGQDPTQVEETTGLTVESTTTAPAVKGNVTVVNLFRHPDAHPIIIDIALLRKYGPEWFEWEPETLEVRIPQDFKTQTVSDINLSKANAIKALHMVDTFWQRWEVFTWCGMPFNGEFPDFEIMQVPTAAQAAVAVDIANRIRQDVEWSEEVKLFMGTVLKFDGLICKPALLDWADIPDAEEYPVDCAAATKLWNTLKESGKGPPTEESPEAEQVRRLFLIEEYVDSYRDQLNAQLSLLAHV